MNSIAASQGFLIAEPKVPSIAEGLMITLKVKSHYCHSERTRREESLWCSEPLALFQGFLARMVRSVWQIVGCHVMWNNMYTDFL